MNLISNSIKFTLEWEKRVSVKFYESNNSDFIIIKIEDEGVGISEYDKKTLFHLFGVGKKDESK